MFDMKDVGRTIAQLRRSRNMTQMELADHMGVSFQAVSNWERGASMPDIAKLPELSQLFCVTIDELLGQPSPLIESAAQGTIESYMQENEVAPHEIADAAPILKPEQLNSVYKHTLRNCDNHAVLSELLPFLGSDMVDEILLKAVSNENYEELGEFAPFASREALGNAAQKMLDAGKSIVELLPFLGGETIKKLSLSIYKSEGIEAIAEILPFIPRDQLCEIVKAAYMTEACDLDEIEGCLPFLPHEFLAELAEIEYERNALEDMAVLAPFLKKETLLHLVKRAIQDGQLGSLGEIAAFLDKQSLRSLFQK